MTRGRGILFLVLFFALPLLAYWPGLSGDYFLDDYAHIVLNAQIHLQQLDASALWTAANSTNSGPLGRPLALASFALNYYATGLDPFYFKLTNLIIHLLTGLGIYCLVRQIAAQLCHAATPKSIAFVVAMLWLLHPLHVSTVMYAVQRMTGMAALLTVWGMVAYCHGRQRLLLERYRSGWLWIATGFMVGGIGLFAKETAVLILGYLFVVEWLAFRFRMPSDLQRRGLQAFYAAAIGLPIAWAFATHVFAPGWIEAAYAKRAFTLDERLLTQARVLWDYLFLTWLPNIQLMGLYHDDYRISRSLFEPASTAFAIAGHIGLVAAAIALRNRWPVFLFAVAWFYVGHSAEASILPLEIKYEHRNYLPMLGMLLLMVQGIRAFTDRLQNPAAIRRFILVMLLLTFAGSTFVRASQFGDFWGFSAMEAEHHPDSSRANQNAASSIIKLMNETRKSTPELVSQATEYLYRSAAANPDSTAPLFTALLFLPELTRQPPSEALMDALALRLREKLPDANTNRYFIALLRQAEDGKLMLPPAQVHMLFEQAEANPYMNNGTKADIIASRATYAQSVEQDNAKAVRLIDRALAMAPTRSGIYVPAVWIYQEAGMWQDAATILEQLKKLDVYGIERNSIAWLSQRQTKNNP